MIRPSGTEPVLRVYCEAPDRACLLYTSDAADERSSVDLGGRRIIKKKKKEKYRATRENKEKKYTRKESSKQI